MKIGPSTSADIGPTTLSSVQGGRSMRKIAVQLGLVLAILASATTSHARIFVKIQDSVGNILDGSNPATPPTVGNFNLSKDSRATTDGGIPNPTYDQPIDVIDTMPLLGCAPGCTVYFPSGSTTQGPNDTLAFSHTNAAGPAARVQKVDGFNSADRISLRGLTIRAVRANLTLTF